MWGDAMGSATKYVITALAAMAETEPKRPKGGLGTRVDRKCAVGLTFVARQCDVKPVLLRSFIIEGDRTCRSDRQMRWRRGPVRTAEGRTIQESAL
jgi:hypothetical protein